MEDYQLLIDTAVLAGSIMLESGAETYRIEDTMMHILKTADGCSSEVFAMTTGIVATLKPDGEKPITQVKRISNRSTNLNKIVEVNGISRKLCSGSISLSEAMDEMKSLNDSNYSEIIYRFAMVGVVLGFVVMYGGGFMEAVVGTMIGIALSVMTAFTKRAQWNSFISDVVSCAGISFLTYLIGSIWPVEFDTNTVIIGAIMPLVPGVAITNAVRDSLQGDYISGGGRMMEAFIKAIAIAVGIGIGMILFKYIAG